MSSAHAAPPCRVGRFDTPASEFHLDSNGDGVWNPDGGDRVTTIDVAGGAGVPVVGDWNGDGYDDVGKQVGSYYRLDLDGDGVWEGNAGGDRNLNFAPSFGYGIPLVGDWNGDGRDEIGTYLRSTHRFLLDVNGNGVWDGNAGGDANAVIQATVGPGTLRDEIVGDWDGDGDDDIGRVADSHVFLDFNGNRRWDGSQGGDVVSLQGYLTIVGDWNGDGRDDLGRFFIAPSHHVRFAVDFDGDWIGSGTGEEFKFAAQLTPGTPVVCDWDGDGTTNLGSVSEGTYRLDLNANGSFEGNAGGDRNLTFEYIPYYITTSVPLTGSWAP